MLTKAEIAREAKLFDTAELARRAGVTTKTIYRIRKGVGPSLDTLPRLIDAMRQMRALGLVKKPAATQEAAS